MSTEYLPSAQVEYPEVGWAWNDFLEKSIALRDSGVGVYGYAPYDNYLDSIKFVYQHGGTIFDDPQDPTRATFDDPLTVEALNWYADLIHTHNVAPTPKQASQEFGLGSTSPYLGFVSGKIGMWTGYLTEQADDVHSWKFSWGMAPLPRESHSASPADSWGYAINSETDFPLESWLWVSF